MSTDGDKRRRRDDEGKAAQLGEVLTGLARYRHASYGLLVRRIGRRGAALLWFAFLDLVYAWSLFSPAPATRRSPSVLYLQALAPLRFWATLWAIAGILCLVNAFRTSDKLGFAGAIAVKVLWGLLFVGAGVLGTVDRAWISSAIWLSMAGWLAIIASWPEPVLITAPRRG